MLLMSIPSYYGISYDIHVHGLSIKPYQPAQECKPPITLCVCVFLCVCMYVCAHVLLFIPINPPASVILGRLQSRAQSKQHNV